MKIEDFKPIIKKDFPNMTSWTYCGVWFDEISFRVETNQQNYAVRINLKTNKITKKEAIK